jgi:hypothetical protein
MKLTSYRKLGLRIAPPDPLHHLAALLRTDYVRHVKSPTSSQAGFVKHAPNRIGDLYRQQRWHGVAHLRVLRCPVA